MAEERRVRLKSCDKQLFVVGESVASESEIIKNMIRDIRDVPLGDVPLPNVSAHILGKVIEYCEYHVVAKKAISNHEKSEDDIKSWDAQFVKVDESTLFDLIEAADYLNIKNLLSLTCLSVADIIIKSREKLLADIISKSREKLQSDLSLPRKKSRPEMKFNGHFSKTRV